jgi:hypothetical protein
MFQEEITVLTYVHKILVHQTIFLKNPTGLNSTDEPQQNDNGRFQ